MPKLNAYKGDTYMLINGSSISITAEFVTVAQFSYFYMNVSGVSKRQGILSDYKVMPTAQNIMKKQDSILEYTLQL